MARCTAQIQHSYGKPCQRESLAGKTKCAAHGSGGVRTAAGKAAIAAAHSKGLGDTRASRIEYSQGLQLLYRLAKLAGITWIGRPPKNKFLK